MKQPYTAPTLTVTSFRVERGFENSLTEAPRLFEMYTFNDQEDLNQAASYTESHWSW